MRNLLQNVSKCCRRDQAGSRKNTQLIDKDWCVEQISDVLIVMQIGQPPKFLAGFIGLATEEYCVTI